MMSDAGPTFCIRFEGSLLHGIKREQALDNLSRLTNINKEELLDALFSFRPVIIKKLADKPLAERYVESFGDAGLELFLDEWDEAIHDEIIDVDIDFGHFAPLERTDQAANYQVDTEQLLEANSGNHSDSENAWHVVFHGKTKAEFERQQVVENIAHLTNASEEQVLENIFSVVPIVIHRSTDKADAEHYLANFSQAGLILELLAPGEVDDGIEVSHLKIRSDAPETQATKPVPRFTYGLLGLAFLAFSTWLFIDLYYAGLFSEQETGQKSLAVQLNYPEPVQQPTLKQEPVISETLPNKKNIAQEKQKVKETNQKQPDIKKEVVATKPKQKPQQKQKAETKAASPPARAEKQIAATSSAQEKATREDYFLTLLNWFAHPRHQGYDENTRNLNLEGEIKIKITIARDGSLLRTEVMNSSSQELTDITLNTAKLASPYPPIPGAISGESYSFVLPLKYTLDN